MSCKHHDDDKPSRRLEPARNPEVRRAPGGRKPNGRESKDRCESARAKARGSDRCATIRGATVRCATIRGYLRFCLALWVCIFSGCTAISIAPTCPNELLVGESGPVRANEENPGGIATYLWEVFPANAGSFADSTTATTTFTASAAGETVVRLTASDGLFQVISECSIRIEGTLGVAVTFSADPNAATVGVEVVLPCPSAGTADAATLAIAQVDGGDVTLTSTQEGVATFTPTQIGDLIFQCVAESAGGAQSEPVLVTVGVSLAQDGNTNDNSNVNDNAGDNGNDNTSDNANDNAGDNANDNGGDRPSRPGRRGFGGLTAMSDVN